MSSRIKNLNRALVLIMFAWALFVLIPDAGIGVAIFAGLIGPLILNILIAVFKLQDIISTNFFRS